MKYEIFNNDTYDLYTIETDKFKSARIEVIFRSKATKENITYLTLLSSILMENSNKYRSRKTLMRSIYNLYNPSIFSSSGRVGNIVLTHFILDFIDPKFTSNDTVSKSIELLFDMILDPFIKDGEFDEETFNRIKKRIMNDIDSIKEDPKQDSILSAFKNLDENDIRSVSALGDRDILKSITPRALYKYYTDFIENAKRDIYVIGSLDMNEINNTIKKYAKFQSITNIDTDIYLPEIHNKSVKNVSKKTSSTQSNLVELYTLNNLDERDRNFCLPIFNMLWGSGSLESKLYKSLREENSLCYNVTSFYQKYDQVLVVHTAVDEANVDLAMKLIKKNLNDMTNGNITDEELDNVKNLMITSLHLILDNPGRIIDAYLFKNIASLPDIEDRINSIREITIKDLSTVARKIKLALTYSTRGE